MQYLQIWINSLCSKPGGGIHALHPCQRSHTDSNSIEASTARPNRLRRPIAQTQVTATPQTGTPTSTRTRQEVDSELLANIYIYTFPRKFRDVYSFVSVASRICRCLVLGVCRSLATTPSPSPPSLYILFYLPNVI